MSNTPQTLEVVSTSARAVAPDLPGRVERIKTYHAGTLRSFRDQMGYAFLAGVEFMALKDTTKHGDFEKLCTEFLGDIPKRTRCRYMDFAEALITKSATVALLAKEPRLLTNSEIAKEDAEKICKAVHDAADGKTLTELYRDLGVIRQPKAPDHPNKCQHCGKPVHAAASTCPHCRKDITPKLSDAEIAAAEQNQANNWVGMHLGQIASLTENPRLLGRISPVKRTIIKAAHTNLGDLLAGKVNAKQFATVADKLATLAGDEEITRTKQVKDALKALKK